jgi:hypothetical protein
MRASDFEKYYEEDHLPCLSGSVAAVLIVVFKQSMVDILGNTLVELINSLGINNIYKVIHG